MNDRPTLEELRERLEGFRQAHRLCDQIDHWPSVLKCRRDMKQNIDVLQAQIARREKEQAA